MNTNSNAKRARWTAVWAALKGLEALVGHLAERAKAKALAPPEVAQ